MKQARFTREAREELLAQIEHCEALREGLGARFGHEVEATALRAAAFPDHGKPWARGTRRRLVTNFPFSLVYTETGYGVLVHAVADSRRLPEYWLSRR